MKRTKPWMYASLILSLAVTGPLFGQAEPGTSAPASQPSVPVDPNAILKAIPADATAFVVVRNLQEVDADVAGVVQQLGLPPGIVPTVVSLMSEKGGLSKGLNPAGSVGIVVLNLADVKEAEKIVEKVAILLPVTNGDEMLGALGGTKEGEFSKVMLMGKDSIAATRPGFVVVSQSPEAVKAVLGAKGEGIKEVVSADRVKAYASQDVLAWLNPRGVSKELRAEVRDGLNKLMSMGGMGATTSAPAENPGLDQIGQAIDQAQEFAVSVSLDAKKGLMIGWYARMREGTELAKQTAMMKGSDKSLLIGLPDEPTILAVGMAGGGSSAEMQAQIRQGMDKAFAMYTQLLGDKIDAEKLNKLKDPLVQLASSIDGVSAGISGLPPEGAEGLVAAEFVARVKNSTEWRAQARKVFEQLKELIVDAAKKEGIAEDKVKSVADAVQWKENAEQVAGGSVDHFIVALDKMPDMTEDTLKEIKTVIGQEGILLRVATVGENHVAVTFGGGSKRLGVITETLKKSEAPLSKNKDIEKVAARLPAGPRVMEGYLSIAHLLTLISNIANEIGQPLPIPALRDSTPIAITSVKVADAAQYSEVLIPMEVVASVKEAVGPLMMMMMGGGMNQPPGAPTAPQSGGELN